MNNQTRIGVIGAGAWGTALAANAARAGHMVMLWARDENLATSINADHQNQRYLPDITLPKTLKATSALDEACKDSDILLLSVPAQTLASMVTRCDMHAPDHTVFISCAKGIDRQSGQTMTQIIASQTDHRSLAVLSGPSFAADVAHFLPTAVIIAAKTEANAMALCKTLSNDTLRCYASDDILGAELGGALKNVLAIAVGIARGKKLGASAEASIIARGFAELCRVATAMGARAETLAGLSGIGDLVLTCSSEKSRNFAYGMAIGEGRSLHGLKLAEGALTAGVATRLIQAQNINAPLIEAVNSILENRANVDDTIAALLARPITTESNVARHK